MHDASTKTIGFVIAVRHRKFGSHSVTFEFTTALKVYRICMALQNVNISVRWFLAKEPRKRKLQKTRVRMVPSKKQALVLLS